MFISHCAGQGRKTSNFMNEHLFSWKMWQKRVVSKMMRLSKKIDFLGLKISTFIYFGYLFHWLTQTLKSLTFNRKIGISSAIHTLIPIIYYNIIFNLKLTYHICWIRTQSQAVIGRFLSKAKAKLLLKVPAKSWWSMSDKSICHLLWSRSYTLN